MGAITSEDVQNFLSGTVNLKRDDVTGYRDQVRFLRERLEGYIKEHPDFALVKMRHFGSLAKGTANSMLYEMDVAVYLRPDKVADYRLPFVLSTVRELLMQVYPTKDASDFVIDSPAVTITYRGSGLQVGVVPVIHTGGKDDRGLLARHGTSEWVETSIPLHLDFIGTRKGRHPDFLPLVRLTKWWRTIQGVPISSFVFELLWAHLLDHKRIPTGGYAASLLAFFSYLERTRLSERIVFGDFYVAGDATVNSDPVQIMDPVNAANNVAAGIGPQDRDALLRAAENAVDWLAQATTAHTKTRGLEAYQRLFGTQFQV